MIKEFAQNSEVKLLIEEKQVSSSQIKNLLARKGIFSLVPNTSQLGEQTYPIFLGSHDIGYLHEIMQSSNSYQKSSMMIIKANRKMEENEDLIDYINDDLQNYRLKKSKYKVEEIVKDSEGSLYFNITYTKKVKGKSALLRDKTKTISAKIEKRREIENIIIDVRQNDNSDIKEFESFMRELNESNSTESLFNIEEITLSQLQKQNKIKFFDHLIACKYKEWKLDDIKGLDIKRVEAEEIEDAESEDVESEVSTDELTGINTAIFKGNSIRGTGIVKKFESQGFYFVSMRLKYSYKANLNSFIIEISFKGGTDGIKIDILKSYEKDENSRDLIHVLPMSEQEKIIIAFQDAAYEIYNNLLEEQRKIVNER